MCVSSQAGLGGDSCSSHSAVVNINTFYPMDRTCTVVEMFSSNPQVGTTGPLKADVAIA